MDKKCIACEEIKPLSEYYKDKRMTDGYRGNCKECHKGTEKLRGKARYDENIIVPRIPRLHYNRSRWVSKEHKALVKRRWYYMTTHGITLEEHNDMLTKQNGACAICKVIVDKLHIDHCHSTNKVRGLLCKNCNWGIGHLRDNVIILQSAIEYISNPGNLNAQS